MRQFVKCQWPNSKRAYTYHFDGEPALAVGERVLVEAPRGEGKVPVTVTEIGVPESKEFETKPVVGRAQPEEPKADAPVSQAKPLDSLFGLDAEGGKPAILPGRSNPFD
jgi:hypothetical protein